MKSTPSTTKAAPVSTRKTLNGVVVSDKMKDTVVVLVERYIKDTKYHKFVNLRKRYHAHNPGNTKKVGDKVTIVSCRPMSRRKVFQILEMTATAAAK